MFGIGMRELIVILFIALLLFGARRIPDIARSMGKGLKSFKDGVNETKDAIHTAEDDTKKDAPKDEEKFLDKQDSDDA